MNKIVNKFLLAGDIFMPEMHLKQPEFKYSAREIFRGHRNMMRKDVYDWFYVCII